MGCFSKPARVSERRVIPIQQPVGRMRFERERVSGCCHPRPLRTPVAPTGQTRWAVDSGSSSRAGASTGAKMLGPTVRPYGAAALEAGEPVCRVIGRPARIGSLVRPFGYPER